MTTASKLKNIFAVVIMVLAVLNAIRCLVVKKG